MGDGVAPAALELTHVLYDANSKASLVLALVTLSPILLMASYAALAVTTRDILIINMWAGQVACEAFNWILKRMIKEERPAHTVGKGYGFPSSHSQYMTYFATFLILHLYFRHRFATTGYWIVDKLWRIALYLALILWAGSVCYSRLFLTYHTPNQILWGAGVGVCFGILHYTVTELIPARFPQTVFGRFRKALLLHPLSTFFRLKDGWAVWEDGGREEEWQAWRRRWEQQESNRKHK